MIFIYSLIIICVITFIGVEVRSSILMRKFENELDKNISEGMDDSPLTRKEKGLLNGYFKWNNVSIIVVIVCSLLMLIKTLLNEIK